MEKLEFTNNIGEEKCIDTDYSYGDKPQCINEIIDFLNKNKENGATHVKFTGYGGEGTIDYIDLQPVSITLESVEAYLQRKENAKQKGLINERMKKAKERELYEELKLKFEK